MADLTKLFREHRVFRPAPERLTLYVLIERLSDGKFSVNATEFLYDRDDLRERMAEVAATTADLMLDEDRSAHGEFFETIAEAIDAHEREFADVKDWIADAQD